MNSTRRTFLLSVIMAPVTLPFIGCGEQTKIGRVPSLPDGGILYSDVHIGADAGAFTDARAPDAESDVADAGIACRIKFEWYNDFESPFCRRFYEDSLPSIKTDYGSQVDVVIHHFPLPEIFPNAYFAAVAAECALRQGKFWEYADLLFQNQGNLTDRNLQQFASNVGLDERIFNECFDAGSNGIAQTQVQNDKNNGQDRAVRGVPTFFIGPQNLRIDGANPYVQFKSVIEEACGRQ